MKDLTPYEETKLVVLLTKELKISESIGYTGDVDVLKSMIAKLQNSIDERIELSSRRIANRIIRGAAMKRQKNELHIIP